MAVYKVPQDVEAEDRLLGPFTFRQFIYLIIVAVMGFFAFALWQLLPILAVIPVPIMVFFAALALPLRKDQPMETYLAAVISFYIKPRVRLWDPDGVETKVEISAPKITEVSLTKNITGDEAERRFAYLAQIIDSKGWATRGAQPIAGPGAEIPNNLNPDMYYEAQETVDILDEGYSVGQNINQRLEQSANQHRQDIIENLIHPEVTPAVNTASIQPVDHPFYPEAPTIYQPENVATPFLQPEQKPVGNLVLNPYPTTINQAVVLPPDKSTPVSDSGVTEQPKNEEKTLSPGIIELVENASEDFSIATLANQAKRISEEEKNLDDDEVIISLR